MVTTSMVELKQHYLAARGAAQRAARYDGASVPESICRYCGKPWRLWNGSKLDGHAKCIVTDGFKAELRGVIKAHPSITYSAIALVLDVSPAVVRSWTFPIRTVRR